MQVVRYARISRHDLVCLQFILESYDGIAMMSTVDREKGVVAIRGDASREAELDSLLDSLCCELGMERCGGPEEGGADAG